MLLEVITKHGIFNFNIGPLDKVKVKSGYIYSSVSDTSKVTIMLFLNNKKYEILHTTEYDYRYYQNYLEKELLNIINNNKLINSTIFVNLDNI